jgi:hypothetical protein
MAVTWRPRRGLQEAAEEQLLGERAEERLAEGVARGQRREEFAERLGHVAERAQVRGGPLRKPNDDEAGPDAEGDVDLDGSHRTRGEKGTHASVEDDLKTDRRGEENRVKCQKHAGHFGA